MYMYMHVHVYSVNVLIKLRYTVYTPLYMYIVHLQVRVHAFVKFLATYSDIIIVLLFEMTKFLLPVIV